MNNAHNTNLPVENNYKYLFPFYIFFHLLPTPHFI